MRIFLIILAIITTYVGGYGYYLWSKASPILKNPRAAVQLVPYQLKPFDGATREIDLGYSHFRLPAGITGEPVQMDDTLFVVLDQGIRPYPIFFGPPVSDNDEQVKSLIEQYRHFTEESLASLFELKKRAIRTQPFTFWSLMTHGKKYVVSEALMLTFKIGIVHFAEKPVQLYENDRIGILIFEEHQNTIVSVYDKRGHSTQEIILKSGTVEIDPLVSALVASYQFTSKGSTSEQLLAELRTTGILLRSSAPPPTTPETTTDKLDSSDLQLRRVKEIADEIRRRRLPRQEEPKK